MQAGSVLTEFNCIRHFLPRFIASDGVVIRGKQVFPCKIILSLFVITPVNRLVGPLEKPILTVLEELNRGAPLIRFQVIDLIDPDNSRGGNVIFTLNLRGRNEVLPQSKCPPKALISEADTKILGHQFLLFVLQLFTGKAVNRIDREKLAPILLPGRFVKTFDREHQILDVHRDRPEPIVVFLRVIPIGRQQLNHRTQRTTLI